MLVDHKDAQDIIEGYLALDEANMPGEAHRDLAIEHMAGCMQCKTWFEQTMCPKMQNETDEGIIMMHGMIHFLSGGTITEGFYDVAAMRRALALLTREIKFDAVLAFFPFDMGRVRLGIGRLSSPVIHASTRPGLVEGRVISCAGHGPFRHAGRGWSQRDRRRGQR